MKKFFTFYFLLLTLLVATPVMADSGQYGQYGQYGGGAPSYSIVIDKMVGNGTQTKGGLETYVDNYSPSDPRFKPGQQVFFQVKVKNTSNVTLKNVQVYDYMPNYISAIEGPGDYNANNNTVSWTYAELKAGEEKVERLVAQIYPQDKLPADKGLMCLNNKSRVQVGNAADEDTAQFCIEKEVVGVQKVPTAGAELYLLSSLMAMGMGSGIYLRKKA